VIVITWTEVAKFLLVFGATWALLLVLIHLDERADRRANRRIDDRLGALDEWDRPYAPDELQP
jgi:Na+(H+)/acetate symporter ActP